MAKQHRTWLETLNIQTGQWHVGPLFVWIGLMTAAVIVSMAHEHPFIGFKIVAFWSDRLPHACSMLVRDKQESGTEINSCRFTVSTDIVGGESFRLDTRIMISRDDVNRQIAPLVTQFLELAVVLNVLVEKIAGDDQLVNFQVGKAIQDVCQRVKTLRMILARGQVNIRCYCDLHGLIFLCSVMVHEVNTSRFHGELA